MKSALLQSKGHSDQTIHGWVAGMLPSPGMDRLLDIGCGKGAFLASLEERGFENLVGCDGLEAEPGVFERIRFVKSDLNSAIPLSDSSFSIVTAIEVIEHLENPRHLAREIARLLEPGGLAIVTTPNNESLTSLMSLAARGRFSAFTDANYPAHITPLLAIDLVRIFKETGFRDIKVSWSDRGRVPATGFHWQSLSSRLFRGRLFSDQLMVRARR